MSSKSRSFQGREAMHRMNFLYQAAEICGRLCSPEGSKLSMYYGSMLKSVGRKTQSRLDFRLKRTLCRGCSTLLVPGDTATVRLLSKPQPLLVWICNLCGRHKNYGTREDYTIWPERTEAILEVFQSASLPPPSQSSGAGVKSSEAVTSSNDGEKNSLKSKKS